MHATAIGETQRTERPGTTTPLSPCKARCTGDLIELTCRVTSMPARRPCQHMRGNHPDGTPTQLSPVAPSMSRGASYPRVVPLRQLTLVRSGCTQGKGAGNALAGMMQTIVPYIPQLAQALAHQHPDAPRQKPQLGIQQSSPTQGEQPNNERLCHLMTEVMGENPNASVMQTASYSRNVAQREFVKSKKEIDESSKGESQFVPEIQDRPIPANFQLPTLEYYDGSTNPSKHIATFQAHMALYDISDSLMCRAFLTTLKGPGWMWYTRLRSSSISSFDFLAKEFELNFLASSHSRPMAASLLGLTQGSDEPLTQFVGRFAIEIRGMPDVHPSLAIQAFLMGLRPSQFL
ncbi:hypothetical protein GW17_00025099 [Ensete ventricosum]|nr:hypothetical protein GW17_00025099 [Ensete ventricosum]